MTSSICHHQRRRSASDSSILIQIQSLKSRCSAKLGLKFFESNTIACEGFDHSIALHPSLEQQNNYLTGNHTWNVQRHNQHYNYAAHACIHTVLRSFRKTSEHGFTGRGQALMSTPEWLHISDVCFYDAVFFLYSVTEAKHSVKVHK